MMRAIYTDNEINAAKKQRKKLLVFWLITLFVWFAVMVAMFVYHIVRVETVQDRTYQNLLRNLSIWVSVAYWFWSIAFLGVKYRYTKAYCKMYDGMVNGLRDKSKGKVLEINHDITEKDSVKFFSLKVECPPVRRSERNIRTLLVEKYHEIDDISVGDEIEFFAHSGIMLGYEILGNTEEAQ